MLKNEKFLPGILLCFAIATPAWFLGSVFPIIGGPIFAILIGMLVVILFPSKLSFLNLYLGVKYTWRKILQYSIILLGFEMNLFPVISVGGQSLIILFFTLSASFLVAYFLGKVLKLEANITTIGVKPLALDMGSFSRILMIVPITFVLAIYTARKAKE